MLSLDISFIFHLMFIIFGCKIMKNLFFIPLYESVFLEGSHNKALNNAFLAEIEKLDQQERVYEKYQKEIIHELKHKVSLIYQEEISEDLIAISSSMVLAENESDESIEQIKKESKNYASFIVKKIYL
jgi:hypothetical protein